MEGSCDSHQNTTCNEEKQVTNQFLNQLAERYDSLPSFFVLVMTLAMSMAATQVPVTESTRRRGTSLGFAIGIAYLAYRYTFGDFEYPAESLLAVLRAYFAGAAAAAIVVILAGAWHSVQRWRWSVRSGLTRVGRTVSKLWTWL